jgi:hypothetical protein
MKRFAGMLIFTFGCGTSVEYTQLRTPTSTLHRKSPQEVELFTTKPPERSYTELGILEARQESQYSADETKEFLDHMRFKAAEIGCDAVVLTGSADQTEHIPFVGNRTRNGLRGTCIIYN